CTREDPIDALLQDPQGRRAGIRVSRLWWGSTDLRISPIRIPWPTIRPHWLIPQSGQWSFLQNSRNHWSGAGNSADSISKSRTRRPRRTEDRAGPGRGGSDPLVAG